MDKRILIISPDYRPRLGGVATCTYELSRALVNEGWNVTLLARSCDGDKSFDKDQDFQTIRLKTPTDATLSIPSYIRAIRSIQKKIKPDLIIHMLWYPSAAAHWLSRCRTPYIIYTHGVELLESSRTLKKNIRKKLSFLKRKVFKRAHHVFSVSSFTKELVLKEAKISPEKISVIPNGIHLKDFDKQNCNRKALSLLEIDDSDFIFLTVCRLVPNKGIDNTLKSLAQIKKEYQFKYIICGEGPDRLRIEKMIDQLQLNNHVLLTGDTSPKDLISYYHLCSCFIMLSRFEIETPAVEGFGISFLEAGACEKPVIAGNSGGVSDAVLDGKSGLLVPPEDIDRIVQSLKKVMESSDLCQELGEFSKKRIEKELTWEIIAQKISQKLQQKIFND